METDNGVRFLAGSEERVPVTREDGGKAQLGGEFGKAHGFEATCRVGDELAHRDLDVGQVGQLQGDDARRMGPRPHLVVPVVVGPHAGQAQFLVLGARVDGSAESRDE